MQVASLRPEQSYAVCCAHIDKCRGVLPSPRTLWDEIQLLLLCAQGNPLVLSEWTSVNMLPFLCDFSDYTIPSTLRSYHSRTLETILEHSSTTKMASSLLDHGAQHRNASVRRTSSHFVYRCLEKIGPENALENRQLAEKVRALFI